MRHPKILLTLSATEIFRVIFLALQYGKSSLRNSLIPSYTVPKRQDIPFFLVDKVIMNRRTKPLKTYADSAIVFNKSMI